MHEIDQIHLCFHLSSMEDHHKGDTYLKMISRNSLEHKKKTKKDEKFARLTTLKDSLGKK